MSTSIDLEFFTAFMEIAESKATSVLLWVLKNKDERNRIYITLDAIAEECQVTKATVNKIFQRLYDKGFMRKVRNGHYAIHPRITSIESEDVLIQNLEDWVELKH